MQALLEAYPQLHQGGQPVGRAVVTSVWGSAPRAEGASLLATADGRIAGSISGGCVESAAAQEIAAAIARGAPALVSFGVSDERAWEVGLACGGTIKVFVQPRVPERVLRAARECGQVIATVIAAPDGGMPLGTSAVIRELGHEAGPPEEEWLAEAVGEAARGALQRETSITIEVPAAAGGSVSVFLEVFPRRPRLVIFGGVHIAMALVTFARALGYYTVVADGRPAFLTRERFPDADELVLGWPEAAFAQAALDAATYVCLLSHDPKFDEPAMRLALRSPARYIGAIGSKRTQQRRRERLSAEGFSPSDIARIHGPIGLDLGGRAPAETALAILAEMTLVRYRGSARSLTPA